MDNKSYLPEAQPDKRLVQPQIQRPRPMPIVLMIGTTHTLPETHQQKLKKKIHNIYPNLSTYFSFCD